jgi:hypothetical protein
MSIPTFREVQDDITAQLRDQGFLAAILVDLGPLAHIERAFGCRVAVDYGASEFINIAFECERGRLHLNADWVILEPVDAEGQPVPIGDWGQTTLLTNLANHVQPLIRYELGDRVRFTGSACACGNRLPLIEVQGREDEVLHLRGADGSVQGLLPLALQNSGLYSPMAWVIIGGLITSTLLARLVTPVMYKLMPPDGHEPKNISPSTQPDAAGVLL